MARVAKIGMDGLDFLDACHELVGMTMTAEERASRRGAYGWQTKAAALLDVSEAALRSSVRKVASQDMVDRLDAAVTGVSEIGATEEFDLQAGHWFVGEPADRKRDSVVLGEVVVTHMSAPKFIMHAEWRRGDYTDDGLKRLPAETVYRVQWLDQPSSRTRKLRLIEQAKKRASDRLYESAMAAAEQIGRSRMVKAACAACGLSREELEAMTDAGLQISKYAADPAGIKAAYNAVDRQIREILDEREKLTPDEMRAFDRGKLLGRMDQQHRFYVLADAHAGAEIVQMIAAKPYRLLPLAHPETVRGKTDEELEAERDFAEMAALDWGDKD